MGSQHRRFNFYRSMGQPAAWVFAATHGTRSSIRRRAKSIESHKSGALLMKELKVPWVNWHSSFARIFASAFGPDDPVANIPVHEQGARWRVHLRVRLAPAITRWAKARLEALTASAAPIARPARIIEQIVTTPTINLISSPQESQAAAASSDPAELPNLLRRR